MSKSSEMALQLQEAEAQKQEHNLSDILINQGKTERELKEELNAQHKKVKDEAKEAKKPQIKNIQGKPLILKGVVEKITTTQNKYGWNSRIEMGGITYYYSSKIEFGVDKLFKVGERAAFTVESRQYKEKEILCINQVFYTL